MKQRKLLLIGLALCACLAASAADIEAVTYSKLVSGISRARAPVVDGRYAVFTAKGSARHAGVAFEHENWQTIHTLQRIVRKDEFGKPQKDSNGKPLESILFYIAEIPEGVHQIRYRMVIDGLWSTDPLNAASEYDYPNGIQVSVLPVEFFQSFQTQNVNIGKVRFVYEGESGAVIRVAGTFNNWDPFMYELEETSPGRYELAVPLPKGTWYYSYYEGSNRLPDNTNPERVYTRDGRVASVVVVE
ncbi:isoamylase [Treponema zuelzerae]|uniref:Isoamylase n=1 Tax=Teretinema zuelzerae TaxID=156 RepID=A0AAE3JJM1_9SPIR|nr:isoamylase [Teretinema zuelzerae]MCD1655678.1 isoamylase [Teretinema zuelzerae]